MPAESATSDTGIFAAGEVPGRAVAMPTIEQAIYARVSGAIIEHQLLPGTRLREEALCEVFDVTRPRIRRVLQRLAHERLVELQVNRGAVVARPTVTEARQVFDARRLVEPELVRRLASRIRTPQVRRLRQILEEEEKARLESNRRMLIRHSGDFHVLIAELAGNDVLADFLRDLVARTSLIIALYERPGAQVCGPQDHWRLLEFLESGETDAAAAFVESHLVEIESNLSLRTRDQGSVDLKSILLGDS